MMPTLATLKNKLIIAGCLMGLLQGCTSHTVTKLEVNSVVKDKDVLELVIGRQWQRVTVGADKEIRTVLKEQSEYYKVPLDFSRPEIHLDPLIINDKHADTVYHPKKNALLQHKIEPESLYSTKEMNLELYAVPNNDWKVVADGENFGLDGYAYMLLSGEKIKIVQALYSGESCQISLEKHFMHVSIESTNDGNNVVVIEREEKPKLLRISIYEKCNKFFSVEFDRESLGINSYYTTAMQGGSPWFLLGSLTAKKIFNSHMDLNFTVPDEIIESSTYKKLEPPAHTIKFDPDAKKLYWFSDGDRGPDDNPNAHLVLNEYDLIAQKKRSILVKLGKPLH